MVKTARALLVALLFGLVAGACSDDTASRDGDEDVQSELAELRDQIAEAEKAAEQQRSGLLGEMAAMRREVLLLSAAMLENRLIASQGGVPEKLVAPARQPDPERAEQLLRHIAATEEALEQAKEAAGGRDGVAGSLSKTAVVTQELTLAQLRLAYFQSAYGLALPGEEKLAPGSGGLAGGGSSGTAAAAEPPPARSDSGGSDSGGSDSGRADSEPVDSAQGGEAEDGGQAGEAAPSRQQQAALQPLREVEVPQLPPASYTRRDYTRIQLLLEEAGFDPGPIDGQWGPRTGNALADFQRAQGLRPNGELDAATLDALGFY